MKTSILLVMVLSLGIVEASPKSMKRYLDGEISANEYMDLSGLPKAPTTVYGPRGQTYTIYER
jgi:hypothetical protein